MTTSDSAQSGPATVVVSPVIVLSRTFDARPASLPDAAEFVRSALGGTTIVEADLRAINTAITDALLTTAGPLIGTFDVVLRLYPDDVEIEVLHAPSPETVPLDSAAVGGSFAEWFSETLRREGMSQENAAQRLGVSVRTVSRWSRGLTEPRMRDVRRITGVFGPVPHH